MSIQPRQQKHRHRHFSSNKVQDLWDRDQRRMDKLESAGKGDGERRINQEEFAKNYDKIDWTKAEDEDSNDEQD